MNDGTRIWREYGVHRCRNGGFRFRVYAPRADEVRLTGDPFDWKDGIPMIREADGSFSCELPDGVFFEGDHYGYRITHAGKTVLKNDPVAFLSQPHSYGSSRVYPFPRGYAWKDGGYLLTRRLRVKDGCAVCQPMNIYEVHLGSFRADCSDYHSAADHLAPYLSRMGYTHLELLPIGEFPFGGSWGYQCLGYFAPSARYGMPEDLMYLVDRMHREGIGVILDFVPAHFPRDEKGLRLFDGTPLYEYESPLRAEMPGWGTLCFDHGKDYVRDFLISSALFFIEQYHIDGLRVDAVSSMLYRDYGREQGRWEPNAKGDNVSEEGVGFLREFNRAIKERFPDVLTFAEESSAWEGVTKPVMYGGLGFSMKWNMGWANDLFSYLALDPVYRQYHHEALTFPLCYAFSEHFLLPISHDEVVYGKRSLFSKLHGDRAAKDAAFRTFFTYFMTFPGKKLTFMGSEFGQENEWNWQSYVEFNLLADPLHRDLHAFVASLNRFYLRSPPLYECDDSWDGFSWVSHDRREQNLIAYLRRDKRGKELLCIVCFAGCGEITTDFNLSGEWNVLFSSTPHVPSIWKTGMRLIAPFALIAKRREPTARASEQKES